jgi:hypothetical protein
MSSAPVSTNGSAKASTAATSAGGTSKEAGEYNIRLHVDGISCVFVLPGPGGDDLPLTTISTKASYDEIKRALYEAVAMVDDIKADQGIPPVERSIEEEEQAIELGANSILSINRDVLEDMKDKENAFNEAQAKRQARMVEGKEKLD